MPNVAIIILNWNGWEDTVECLESLFQINYPNFDVVLIDNDSDDGSIEKIRQYCSGDLRINSKFFKDASANKPIEIFEYTEEESKRSPKPNKSLKGVSKQLFLIKNNQNQGFTGGNNIGINFALGTIDPDYVLLLNNDTVVDKNFLGELVFYAEENLYVGVMGPKIYYYDMPNQIQVTSARLDLWTGRNSLVGDGEIDHGQYNSISVTDYVSGACFFIRRDVIDKVGWLDSNFKCYWEETDYCMSVRKLGYKCIYYPNAMIWHKVSKSTNKVKGILTYYMARNMFWFMKKHADVSHTVVFLLFFFGLKIWYVLIDFLYRKRYVEIPFFLKGIKDGIK